MNSVSPDKAAAAERAIGWVESRRSEFALPAGETGEGTLRALKPIGELVLIAEKLVRGDSPHSARGRAWLAWAWEALDGGDLLLDILAARPDLIILSTVYASFDQCGFVNRRLRETIESVHEMDAIRAIEFPYWRRLDVRHAMAGLHRTRLGEDAMDGSWLSFRPEPWLLNDDAAYAVTHEIFYATDYGGHPAGVAGELGDYLRLWLPVWLRIYQRRRNFDLFAELLMCAGYLGFADIHEAGLPALLAEQMPDGAFPGPAGSAANLITSATPGARAHFLRNYHTTLVGILALTAR